MELTTTKDVENIIRAERSEDAHPSRGLKPVLSPREVEAYLQKSFDYALLRSGRMNR